MKVESNSNQYEEKTHQKTSKNTQNIIKRIKKANRDIWTAEEVFSKNYLKILKIN